MIFIALGSSIGKAKNIFESTENFLKKSGIKILKKSKILKNPPFGGVAKNEFSNAVWQIEYNSGLKNKRGLWSARKLLKILQSCENFHDRKREKHWDDRTLDLDILIFHDLKCDTKILTMPHKEMFKRDFVMIPLGEISDIYK